MAIPSSIPDPSVASSSRVEEASAVSVVPQSSPLSPPLTLEARMRKLFDLGIALREARDVSSDSSGRASPLESLDELNAVGNSRTTPDGIAIRSALRSQVVNTELTVDQLYEEIEQLQESLLTEINSGSDPRDGFLTRLPFDVTRITTNDDFAIRIFTNKITNTIRYRNEVSAFVVDKKDEIIRKFYKGGDRLEQERISFKLRALGDESHHQGSVPVEISFKMGDNVILKVVYKPRSAALDRMIISLFRELNSISELSPQLPEYEIWDLEGHGRSVWEYIEGRALADNAGSVLSRLESEEYRAARTNLARLEAVCKAANITDLHMENVILNRSNQWVPIDLEVIRPDFETGLNYCDIEGAGSSRECVNGSEIACLADFHRRMERMPVRHLLLATTRLLEIHSDAIGFVDVANHLLSEIARQKFNLLINEEDFIALVRQDAYNHDVPFFSLFRGDLYYGRCQDGKIIATVRSE